MTGRQKIQAALSPEGTSQTPAVICYEWIYLRDHWSQLTGRPWWHVEAPDLDRQADWLAEVIGNITHDWFCLPCFYSKQQRAELTVEQDERGVFLVNRATGARRELQREPSVAGWDGFRERPTESTGPQTPAEIDQAIPLEADFDPARFLAAGHGDLAARLLASFGASLYPIQHVTSPLWQCHALWGYEGMMMQLIDRPELVRYACERALARARVAIAKAATVGTMGIWIEECFTDSISPAAFAEFNVPMVRRLVDTVRQAGMHSIYYYCGNPWDRFELLLACGADALSLEEGKKGFEIDIDQVVARANRRCAVLGNLDAIRLLPTATDATLRAEIARQIAAGRRNGGRFIMSLGSPVTPATPAERVRTYCRLVRELGSD